MPHYAVAIGRNVGIYDNWDDTKEQIYKYTGAKFKKFTDMDDAKKYINENSDTVNYNMINFAKKDKTTRDYFKNLDQRIDKDNNYRDKVELISKSVFKEKIVNPDDTMYLIRSENNFNFKENEMLDIFTDGSCLNNGRENASSGYGINIPSMPNHNIENSFIIKPYTNNRAELFAIIHVVNILPYLREKKSIINIYTDSTYSIKIYNKLNKILSKYGEFEIHNILTKFKKHQLFDYNKENPINNKPIFIIEEKKKEFIFSDLEKLANPDLVLEFMYVLKKNKIKFNLEHVKAHKKNDNYLSINNNIADKLANNGARTKVFKYL